MKALLYVSLQSGRVKEEVAFAVSVIYDVTSPLVISDNLSTMTPSINIPRVKQYDFIAFTSIIKVELLENLVTHNSIIRNE